MDCGLWTVAVLMARCRTENADRREPQRGRAQARNELACGLCEPPKHRHDPALAVSSM